jgi:hypothetical protein
MLDHLINLNRKLALTLLRVTPQRNPHLLTVNHFPTSTEHSGNEDQALPFLPLVYGLVEQKRRNLKPDQMADCKESNSAGDNLI